MSILITGISGGLAQRVAEQFIKKGRKVVGVDYREVPPLEGALSAVKIYRANYNKTAIEDIFKHHTFDTVLHLGRVGNLKEELQKRFDLNVIGSQKIMNLCLQHHVKRLVVLSTFHIYGADPRNHIPIAEDEPLRAGTQFPQIADAIQLDNLATTWVYQHEKVRVVVLRPTNVVGPRIRNAMSNFLRAQTVPYLAGYNPMMQFIHEDDLAGAVVLGATGDHCGIFNLAGQDMVPWRTALSIAHARTFPVPSLLLSLLMRGFSQLPAYLINFFKYPCIITDQAFREKFGWSPRVDLRTTIESTVEAARAAEAAA